MSSAKLKFNCTHGERAFGHPHRSFSTWRTCLPHQRVSLSFFHIPSLGRGFCVVSKRKRERERRRERARGSFHKRSPRNTTVVRDNDNQRVKWGLISFGCGRWRETRTRVAAVLRSGAEGKEAGKCVYTPAKKHAGLYTT